MFLALSKTLDAAVNPVVWVLLLLAAALLARRRPRRSSALVLAAGAVLWGFSTELVSNTLATVAERPAERTIRDGLTYDVIVVLSGMVDDRATQASGDLELTADVDRVVAGFELMRQGRGHTILLSGGPLHPDPGDPNEAELLAAALRRWGIDPARIAVEGVSRNTRESAVAVARLAAGRGWRSMLLLTSAYHMPRALGCFRKVGLSPDALPVDHRAAGAEAWGLSPRAAGLETSARALHELLGRLAYRLVGYT